MKLKVDNNKKLEILESEILLTGNVNSYILEFDIDSSYEDFTITLVFKNNKKIIKKVITYETEKIEIPHEILEESGDLYIGLFAEKLEDDTLIQRNSVNLVTLYVEEGSYTDDGEYTEPIETTILEQYLQQMLEFYNNSKTTFDENAQNKTQSYNENAATKTQEFTDVADKAASDINNVVEKLEEDVASHVYDGATFIPNVDTEGNISWTNNQDFPNPETRNIRGPQGPQGETGPVGPAGAVKIRMVDELPDVSEAEEGVLYFVPKEETETAEDLYEEYVFTDGRYEFIGSRHISIDLTDYVKFTDYGTEQKAGVIKTGNSMSINGTGQPVAIERTYEQYTSMSNTNFIGKGTLENFITGKELVNKTYVDTIVGDIGTILDNINGESVGA